MAIRAGKMDPKRQPFAPGKRRASRRRRKHPLQQALAALGQRPGGVRLGGR